MSIRAIFLRLLVSLYTWWKGKTHLNAQAQPWIAWQLRDIGLDLKALSLL